MISVRNYGKELVIIEKNKTDIEKNKKDKEKKQLLLRLSSSLWEELASWAEDDFRSINGQIEYLLHECVKKRKKTSKKSAE